MPIKMQPVTETIKTALTAGPQQQIEYFLKKHSSQFFINTQNKIKKLRQTFERAHYVRLDPLIPLLLQTGVRGEASDLLIQTSTTKTTPPIYRGQTPLKISQTAIEQKSIIIPSIYYSQSLRQLLSLITTDDVVPCSSKSQGIELTSRDSNNHNESWLCMKPTYQLIWFLEAPIPGKGGALEFTKKLMAQNTPSNNSYPSVQTAVQRKYHQSGSAFLLRTDTHLYRFASLAQDAKQIMVSMGFFRNLPFNKD